MFQYDLGPPKHALELRDYVSVLHQEEGGIGKSIPAGQFPETQEIFNDINGIHCNIEVWT